MRLYANQLSGHLQSNLASVYLIAGDEVLLVDECCQAVRKAAAARGYAERQVLTVEPGFDWNTLQAAVQSLSLFSSKRLVELRLMTGVPAENGARMLSELAPHLQDVLLLISTGRLDKRTQNSRWVQALESAGVVVLVYPLEASALPGWIAQRMRTHRLMPERGVAELLAYHFEGNLLGVAQEVDKLAVLHGAATVSLDDVRDDLSDNARFSVFTLVDTCLRGEPASVQRILASLRGDGTEPILILRVLAREARSLAQIAARLARGERESQVLQSFGVWPRRRALVTQALRRGDAGSWHRVLCQAARADKILKGRLPGDIWQELQCLALAMCGELTGVCAVMEIG